MKRIFLAVTALVFTVPVAALTVQSAYWTYHYDFDQAQSVFAALVLSFVALWLLGVAVNTVVFTRRRNTS